MGNFTGEEQNMGYLFKGRDSYPEQLYKRLTKHAIEGS